MFWQNCFSVHLNFLFPSLGSGSLSNYSWEVNKYLVSCQTQEVLQIGNCFFSAKILVLIAAFSSEYSKTVTNVAASGLQTVSFTISSHDSQNSQWCLHDTHDPSSWPRMLHGQVSAWDWHQRPQRCGPGQWMVWAVERPVIWWNCTHCTQQYTCTVLPSSIWALVLYNLNPTINCRRFSLFTHTAGHNTIKPAAGVLAERREIKENYFLLQTVSLSNAGGLSTGLSI